jgi:hypothetical protein
MPYHLGFNPTTIPRTERPLTLRGPVCKPIDLKVTQTKCKSAITSINLESPPLEVHPHSKAVYLTVVQLVYGVQIQ